MYTQVSVQIKSNQMKSAKGLQLEEKTIMLKYGGNLSKIPADLI